MEPLVSDVILQKVSNEPITNVRIEPEVTRSEVPTNTKEPIRIDPIIIFIPNQPTMPQETVTPVEVIPEAPIASTILAENISKRPAYSNCYGNPVQMFWVRVFDKDGKEMAGQPVSISGTVEGFEPYTTFTEERPQGLGALFSVTIKGIEEGTVSYTFTSGSLTTPAQEVKITKVSDTERPSYCDPVFSIEETSNAPVHRPLEVARAEAADLQEKSKLG